MSGYNEHSYKDDFFQLNCSVPVCEGPLEKIYYTGPILFAAWYFGFQSTCPGTRLIRDAEEVEKSYEKLPKPVKVDDFKKFCDQNFDSVPYLREAKLADWTEEPRQFADIKDNKMKSVPTNPTTHPNILKPNSGSSHTNSTTSGMT